VVLGRVDSIHPDDIGLESHEVRDISLAARDVGKGIDVSRVGRGCASCSGVLLVGDALEKELGSVGIEELGALYYQNRHVSQQSRETGGWHSL
jgi:hypothetical protein